MIRRFSRDLIPKYLHGRLWFRVQRGIYCPSRLFQISPWALKRSLPRLPLHRDAVGIIPTFLTSKIYCGVCLPRALTPTTVRNGSKFQGRFRFQFRRQPDCGNKSYHTWNLSHWKWAGLTTNNPAFWHHNFASNYVFEFWSYHDMISTYIVQF